jgi:polysaccharide biosynthesis protein PslG
LSVANTTATSDRRACVHLENAPFVGSRKGLAYSDLHAGDEAILTDLGVGWLRIEVDWSYLQPTKTGPLVWAPFDEAVGVAHKASAQVLLLINHAPAWASGQQNSLYAPSNLAAYLAIVTEIARRYFPLGVRYYEIWNEPNLKSSWGPAVDPVAYANMLHGACQSLVSVSRDIGIVSAGLAPNGTEANYDASVGVSPVGFLKAMCLAGAGGSFSILGWHPYNWSSGPPSEQSHANAFRQMQSPDGARNSLEANCGGQRQIWATEYGAPSQSDQFRVSADIAARWLVEGYDLVRTDPTIGPVFAYTLTDFSVADKEEGSFGFMSVDKQTKKPAYEAYKLITG